MEGIDASWGAQPVHPSLGAEPIFEEDGVESMVGGTDISTSDVRPPTLEPSHEPKFVTASTPQIQESWTGEMDAVLWYTRSRSLSYSLIRKVFLPFRSKKQCSNRYKRLQKHPDLVLKVQRNLWLSHILREGSVSESKEIYTNSLSERCTKTLVRLCKENDGHEDSEFEKTVRGLLKKASAMGRLPTPTLTPQELVCSEDETSRSGHQETVDEDAEDSEEDIGRQADLDVRDENRKLAHERNNLREEIMRLIVEYRGLMTKASEPSREIGFLFGFPSPKKERRGEPVSNELSDFTEWILQYLNQMPLVFNIPGDDSPETSWKLRDVNTKLTNEMNKLRKDNMRLREVKTDLMHNLAARSRLYLAAKPRRYETELRSRYSGWEEDREGEPIPNELGDFVELTLPLTDQVLDDSIVAFRPEMINFNFSGVNNVDLPHFGEMTRTSTEARQQSDEDQQSDISEFSVRSVDSVFSIATGVTLSSMSSRGLLEGPMERLVLLLWNDISLQNLYQEALIIKIQLPRFERNYRRLLKQFAIQLRKEADGLDQDNAARFVRYRARNAAHEICDRLRSTNEPNADKRQSSEKPNLLPDDIDENDWDDSDDSDEIDDPDEGQQDLVHLERFILESRAFDILKQRLRYFIYPQERKRIEDQNPETRPFHEMSQNSTKDDDELDLSTPGLIGNKKDETYPQHHSDSLEEAELVVPDVIQTVRKEQATVQHSQTEEISAWGSINQFYGMLADLLSAILLLCNFLIWICLIQPLHNILSRAIHTDLDYLDSSEPVSSLKVAVLFDVSISLTLIIVSVITIVYLYFIGVGCSRTCLTYLSMGTTTASDDVAMGKSAANPKSISSPSSVSPSAQRRNEGNMLLSDFNVMIGLPFTLILALLSMPEPVSSLGMNRLALSGFFLTLLLIEYLPENYKPESARKSIPWSHDSDPNVEHRYRLEIWIVLGITLVASLFDFHAGELSRLEAFLIPNMLLLMVLLNNIEFLMLCISSFLNKLLGHFSSIIIEVQMKKLAFRWAKPEKSRSPRISSISKGSISRLKRMSHLYTNDRPEEGSENFVEVQHANHRQVVSQPLLRDKRYTMENQASSSGRDFGDLITRLGLNRNFHASERASSISSDTIPASKQVKVGNFFTLLLEHVSSGYDLLWRAFHWEDRVPEGKVRIRWKCACGKVLCDDFTELQEGAAKRFEATLNQMSQPPSSTRSQSTYGSVSSSLSSISSIFSQTFQSFRRLLGGKEAGLPTTEPENANIPSQPANPRPTPVDTLYLLLCRPQGIYANTLAQPEVTTLTSDKEFFNSLRSSYTTCRSFFKSLFSFRTLTSINFIHFELYRSSHVDIRLQNDIPPPTHPEYKYNPTPADLIPPIGHNHLMHLFAHPEHADDSPILLGRVPKKLNQPLAIFHPTTIPTARGWGLQFGEGWNARKTWGFAFALFAGGSVVFLSVWLGLGGSVQDGFAVAAYVVVFIVVTVGFVQAIVEGPVGLG